ncbi:MAG: DNA polymerase I [Ignavibacteria bacterium]|nr:DNA polymerase I [Ignavibacteria bacterium]
MVNYLGKRIYLIDGMSVVFRAYHALSRSGLKSPITNEPTYAVFAFTNILTSLLEKENPEYIAVLFDSREPTFRHEIYKEYKANREAFPEDLVPQLNRIKELLDAFGIKRIEIPGLEADDIAGTLSNKLSKEGWNVVCITNDKDYYQLVKDNVILYKTGKNLTEGFEIITPKEVEEKFGVPPNQVVDVLAIVGDSVDNVPGVKGIGEKTAIPLIKQFGSLENLYSEIDKIPKETLKQKLLEHKNEAFLSKKLVTIETNANIDINIDELKFEKPNLEKIDKLFRILDFKVLRERILNKFGETLEEQPTEGVIELSTSSFKENNVNYFLVDTFDKFKSLINKLQNVKSFAIDTETSSLDKLNCELVGISICFNEAEAYYIPVYGNEKNIVTNKINENPNNNELELFSQNNEVSFTQKNQTKIDYNPKLGFPSEYALSKLKDFFENPKVEKYGQNIKFDAFILKRYGINLQPISFDTMVASYVLNPDDQHNLDALAKKWLNYNPISITTLIGEKRTGQKSMRELAPKDITNYACEDADLAFRLTKTLAKELEKQNLKELAEKIEFPLIEVLCEMEFNGVYVSKEILSSIALTLTQQVNELKEKIFEEAGVRFNLDSPKQLGQVLFEKMQLPVIAKTKTGYSTDVSVLTQLAESFPIARDILEYRQRTKLLSTYVEALPELIYPKTGRIHTTFNQTITSTGRLSSTDPNLQNIPIRSEFGKEIRKAFVPQNKDWLILSADYSQIELRIIAYISGDRNLIDAFKNGLDIHAATASILFNKPLDKVDSDMRRVAKTVNFGILYGLGAFGLSQRLGIGRSEAQNIIDNYLQKYPGIKKYVEETISSTQKKGYAETLCGRRRYFPNITSQNRNLRSADERAAINLPIQGTAADMMKLAMIGIHKKFKKYKFKSMMILQIHDELLFEVPYNELESVKEIIQYEMQNALSLGEVPIVVDIGIGESWFDAH